MKKFCTKCGKQFEAVGREVICQACKQASAEDAKRAAVLKAKRASWNGESVPVRISGRASTVIRRYGAANGLPFAQALDDLLKATTYFKGTGSKWEDITPYKSHRRDKNTTEDEQEVKTASKPHDVKQAAGKPQAVQAAKVTKTANKPQEVKTAKAASKAVKTAAGKKAGKKA